MHLEVALDDVRIGAGYAVRFRLCCQFFYDMNGRLPEYGRCERIFRNKVWQERSGVEF